MAKVVAYNAYPPPPAGLQGVCSQCGAVVETGENEEKYSHRRVPGASSLYAHTWSIPCPRNMAGGLCPGEVNVSYRGLNEEFEETLRVYREKHGIKVPHDRGG